MANKKQTTILDTDNYYDLLRPYESQEAAQEAMEAFWNDFYELRNKHRIADAYVILQAPVKSIGPVMLSMHAGNDLMAENMTAWAYGREQADRQARTAQIYDRAMTGLTRKSSK
jgi:hypothetical protein